MLTFKLKTLTLFVILCATLSSGEAHAFGRKPVVVPPPAPTPPPVITPAPAPTPAPTPPPSIDVIRARWETKNRDGALWSQHVFDIIPTLAPNLLSKDPADVESFCPAYPELSATDKKNFWIYLLSSLSELESSHNPNTTYQENFKDQNGNYVISSGLLQISIESGNAYGCHFKTQADLLDPIQNLDCGLRILNKWVAKDTVISGKTTSWLGGARYWSTLRNSKLTQIQGWTKAQRICGK